MFEAGWAAFREGPFELGLEVELEEEVVDCAVEPVNVRTRGALPLRECLLYQSLKPGVVFRNTRQSAHLAWEVLPLHYVL